MTKTKAKAIYQFDTLLEPVCRAVAPPSDWRDELWFMQAKLKEIVENESEENEAHGFFSDLVDLFELFDWQQPYMTDKKKIREWIGGMMWDNFYDDETGKPYSLGSMYWNKLTWVSEAGEEEASEDAIEFATKTVDILPAFLDAVEVYANMKEKKSKG